MIMKTFHSTRSVTSYREVGDYVAPWAFPKSFGKLFHLFTGAANRNNVREGTFNCTASEFLTLASVLARYLGRAVTAQREQVDHVRWVLAVLLGRGCGEDL